MQQGMARTYFIDAAAPARQYGASWGGAPASWRDARQTAPGLHPGLHPSSIRRQRMRYLALGTIGLALLVGAGVWAAEEKEEGFVPLFNGKDLTGWEGDTKLWIVEDGMLVGRSPGISYNDFLATTKPCGDFVLRLQVRLLKNEGNSGVQFRSKRVPNSHEVAGYQADAAPGWWGKLYDEARRGKVLAGPTDEVLKKALKPGDWNDYEIRAVGAKIALTLNGVKTAEYTEEDKNIPRDGIFAVQIHSGGPMEVQFKNLRLKEIKEAK
jgi:hypothetical protein